MIALRAICLALLVPFLCLVVPGAAVAGCGQETSILNASETCDYSSEDIDAEKVSDPSAVWSVRQICKIPGRDDQGVCFNPQECTTAAGTPGTRYTLTKNGDYFGIACLGVGEPDKIGDPPPIRVLVIAAFENLDWPASDLVVQPPGGKTLVNLDTNFYTTNTEFTVIPVTLVESAVRIQAEPVAYMWHFGDDTSVTTSSPGNPYPDLDVAHVYEQVDEVKVSVDTKYGSASFSVDGGDWEGIPSTIWVEGAESDLAILEAKPQLVIR